MKNLIWQLSFLIFVFSCTDAAQPEGLLTKPPYNKLTDSIQLQPQAAGLYYKRGALLYQHEEWAAAKQDLRQAWQLEPTEAHALSMVTVLKRESPDSAIGFIQTALQQLPKSISLQIGLARGYQQKGQWDQAVAICDQVLIPHPNALDALLLKAEILKQQGKNRDALAALEQAHSFAPFDAELSYNLAFEYAEAKDQKIIALTDSLIRADTAGEQAQPYYLKGVYYANTGKAALALDFFNQAIAHDYNFFDAHMDKGVLLYDQKKYAEALPVFERVARITPTYAESYYWAGRCQEALGKKGEAKLNYQRAYGLDKNLTEASAAAAKL